jgi:hypothetical protein
MKKSRIHIIKKFFGVRSKRRDLQDGIVYNLKNSDS